MATRPDAAHRGLALLGLALALILAGCAPDESAPPTPTKTPPPDATALPRVVMPTQDALAATALTPTDMLLGFEPDAENTGPLTLPDLIAVSSAETGAFLQSVPDTYGYRSAFTRATSLDELAIVRDWVLVFPGEAEAARFMQLHPSVLASEREFAAVPQMPAYGDESAGYRAVSDNSNIAPGFAAVQLERYDVIIRRGNLVAVLFAVTPNGRADLVQLEVWARLLDARLGVLIA